MTPVRRARRRTPSRCRCLARRRRRCPARRALQAKGRLHEALAALDGVPHGDAAWRDAQALRAAIQRQLLAGAGTPLAVRRRHTRPGRAAMRCPKCRYISFDDHDRCRNCGYDFSLIGA